MALNYKSFSGGRTHGSRRAVVAEKTCKMWRTLNVVLSCLVFAVITA